MPKFRVTVGPASTPVYPGVSQDRTIGPQRHSGQRHRRFLDDAVIPLFLGLIYPIVGIELVASSPLHLVFPLMSGFALIGPFRCNWLV